MCHGRDGQCFGLDKRYVLSASTDEFGADRSSRLDCLCSLQCPAPTLYTLYLADRTTPFLSPERGELQSSKIGCND